MQNPIKHLMYFLVAAKIAQNEFHYGKKKEK